MVMSMSCPSVEEILASGSSVDTAVVASGEVVGDGNEEMRVDYGPWMLVERKSMRSQRDSRVKWVAKLDKDSLGSRFAMLIAEGASNGDLRKSVKGFSGEKGEGNVARGLMGNKARVMSLKDLG